MKKIMLIALIMGVLVSTTFAQKGLFGKNKDKNATEKVEEVEEKIEKETKELKGKASDVKDDVKEKMEDTKEKVEDVEEEIEEKAGDTKEKVSEMKEEMKEKMEDLKEQEVKDAVDETEKSIDAIDEATDSRKAAILEQMKEKIAVEEEEGSISSGLQSGYVVNIRGAEPNKVEKHWKKYLKSAFKGKTDLDKDGEILAEGVDVPSVGTNVNIYAKVKEMNNGASISTYFDTGENYLTSVSNPEGHKLIEKLMYDFGIQERKYAIGQEIEDEEKALKKLEKDIKNLKEDNEKYHKTIEKVKQEIVNNEQDQVEKNAEISNQSLIIEAVKKLLDTVE